MKNIIYLIRLGLGWITLSKTEQQLMGIKLPN